MFASLEHREPDRVPLFYRSIPEVDERLKRDLDLPDDDALLRHLDIDFRWMAPRYVGPSLEIEGKPNRNRNIWGKDCYRDGLIEMSSRAKRFGAKYYQHCCGGVRELIPHFIEIGVDVVDPLQVLAKGMDPAKLKQQFGDHITFSGGMDEQELLPSGTPEDVRAEVVRMCDIMALGGGYFLGSTHNFQEDVPTENIVAMYEAAREWKCDEHQSN